MAHGDSTDQAALVLTGGGARAAYQVGILRCLARHMPEAPISILTGVSAGAINATSLAARSESFPQTVDRLTSLWTGLSPDRVFRVDTLSLLRSLLRWGLRLVSGGGFGAPRVRSLLDTTPLRRLLDRALEVEEGPIGAIGRNLEAGKLNALAVSTLNFATGQTVTWVQGCDLQGWQRPMRIGVNTEITVDHVMASAALPLIFPAVKLGDAWHGDGGVRMYTPLAPAIHLGADRVLAVSTRFRKSQTQAAEPVISGYPPPAQLAGVLLNAIFLDAVDQDALRLERINRLLRASGKARQGDLRPIRLLVLRPSIDLGRLAAQFEPRLPRPFRFFTRGLGTRETSSPDFLSLLLFQSDYLSRLVEVGEQDAERRLNEIEDWLTGPFTPR